MIAAVEDLYLRFGGYGLPRNLTVCEQCGPEWSAADIRSTPLRSLTLVQLEALHVMSLRDDEFRHFFPRLIESLLAESSPICGMHCSADIQLTWDTSPTVPRS